MKTSCFRYGGAALTIALIGCFLGSCSSEPPPPIASVGLIEAAKTGNIAMVKAHIHHGSKLDVIDEHGMTALDYAIQNDDAAMHKLLMDTGVFGSATEGSVGSKKFNEARGSVNAEKRISTLMGRAWLTNDDEGAVEADYADSPFVNSIGLRFVHIPPGEYLMQSAGLEGFPVKLTKGFLMSVTEVTQAQWLSLMEKHGSSVKGENLPVEASELRAEEFCQKLSEKEGRRYRLPTEEEWEYACRAGTATDYHSGDGEAALHEVGWYERNSFRPGYGLQGAHAVGQKKPNAWGLYDMHGNVWEWCINDPSWKWRINSTRTQHSALRGGSAVSDSRDCKIFRRRISPSATAVGGVRLVLELD